MADIFPVYVFEIKVYGQSKLVFNDNWTIFITWFVNYEVRFTRPIWMADNVDNVYVF